MTHLLIRLLVIIFSLLLVTHIVPGVEISSLTTAALVALVLGIVNATVRPVLLLLTLPVTILTLGLSVFVLNALMFWVVSLLVPGFSVDGFLPALLGSLLLSVVSVLVNRLVHS